jgi:hypothetical protein
MLLAELVAKMTVDGKVEVMNALQQMEVGTEKTANKFQNLTGIVSGMGVAISAFVGKALYDFKNVSESIYRFTQMTGLASDEAQSLVYAAGQEDIAMNDLQVGIKNLAKAMKSGIDETGNQITAVKNLGLITNNTNGTLKSTPQFLMEVADKFKGLTNETEKTIYAQQLFGKSGYQLIPFLNLGAAGIEKLMQRAKELGIIVGGDDIVAGKKFADLMRDVSAVVKSLGIQLAVSLLPYLQVFSETIISVVSWVKKLPPDIQSIIIGITSLIGLLGTLNTVLRMIGISFNLLNVSGIGLILTGLAIAITSIINTISAGDRYVKQFVDSLASLNDNLKRENLKGEIALIDLQLDQMYYQFGNLCYVNTEYIKLLRERKKLTEELHAIEQLHYDDYSDAGLRNLKIQQTTAIVTATTTDEIMKLIDATKKQIEQTGIINKARKIAQDLGFNLNQLDSQSTEIKKRFVEQLTTETRATEKLIYTQEELEKIGKIRAMGDLKYLTTFEAFYDAYSKLQEQGGTNIKLMYDYAKSVLALDNEITNLQTAFTFLQSVGGDLTKLSEDQLKHFVELAEGTNKAIDDTTKAIKVGLVDLLTGTARQAIDMFSNAMIDMLNGGKSAWDSFTKALLNMLETLIAKLLLTVAVAELLNVITGGGWGAGTTAVKGFGGIFKYLMGYDYPSPDMYARKQGRDFIYNFNQGVASRMGTPQMATQPIRVNIYNANPETYVEILSSLPNSQKQQLYENAILPGQRRFEKRD